MKDKILYLISGLTLSSGYFLLDIEFEIFAEILRPETVAEVLGPYGPLGIITGQILQVLFAPVPPVTAVASGLLYGPYLGAIISIIGASIGSIIAIYLSDRYGRPLVKRFISSENMEKFDEYTEKTGYLPFILLFVLPGFPDDALCFIAGLTNLNWKKLAFIASIGRLPGIMMLTTTGYSLGVSNQALFITASILTIIISTAPVRYRKEIQAFTESKFGFVKKSFESI